MSRVLAHEPRRHRSDARAGSQAEWIRARAIGFGGFRHESDLIEAAAAGWRSLQAILHRHRTVRVRHDVDWDRLRFVHDGAHEWVSDGRIPLARVFRVGGVVGQPSHDAGGGPEAVPALAIEFVIPSWIAHDEAMSIAGALRMAIAPLRQEMTIAESATAESAIAPIERWSRSSTRPQPDPPSAA